MRSCFSSHHIYNIEMLLKRRRNGLNGGLSNCCYGCFIGRQLLIIIHDDCLYSTIFVYHSIHTSINSHTDFQPTWHPVFNTNIPTPAPATGSNHGNPINYTLHSILSIIIIITITIIDFFLFYLHDQIVQQELQSQ